MRTFSWNGEDIGAGGPDKCPAGSCDGCGPDGSPLESPLATFLANHHFNESMTTDAGLDPDSEAVKLGLGIWYPCKHCEAWIEELPEVRF